MRTLEAKMGSRTMVISLSPDGEIMIQDYSQKNDRQEIVRRLQEMGVKTETVLESLCG